MTMRAGTRTVEHPTPEHPPIEAAWEAYERCLGVPGRIVVLRADEGRGPSSMSTGPYERCRWLFSPAQTSRQRSGARCSFMSRPAALLPNPSGSALSYPAACAGAS